MSTYCSLSHIFFLLQKVGNSKSPIWDFNKTMIKKALNKDKIKIHKLTLLYSSSRQITISWYLVSVQQECDRGHPWKCLERHLFLIFSQKFPVVLNILTF